MTEPANKKAHSVSNKIYLRVGAALLVLTAITVGVSQIPLGGYNLVIALVIATAKALLVALFFMHLLYDNRFYLVIVGTALGTLMIFIILTLFDTLNRGLIDSEVARPIREQAVIYRQDTMGMDTVTTRHVEAQAEDSAALQRHAKEEAGEDRH